MITIVDYGVGNLFSLQSSFQHIGVESRVVSQPEILQQSEKLLLPGVGAFGDAMKKITASGIDIVVKEHANNGKPLLGICLGMQILFEKSCEYGEHQGLGILSGTVDRFQLEKLGENGRIPHAGWNTLFFKKESPLIQNVAEGSYVYYVHSYYVKTGSETLASSVYGDTEFTAIVSRDNIFGTQFHPEKSGETGLTILKNFSNL